MVESMWKLRKNLEVAVCLVGIFLIWEFMSRFVISPLLLPPPSVAIKIAITPDVLINTYITIKTVIVGYFMGTAIGILIGFFVVYFPTLGRNIYPLIFFIGSIPASGFVPILIFWVGIGLVLKLSIVVIVCFFPVVVNTVAGLKLVDPGLVELMRSLKATRRQEFTKVRFKSALPHIFSGLKIAAPLAVIGAVIAELFAGNEGIGFLTISASASMNIPLLFASILWAGTIGIPLYGAILITEKLISPWYLKMRE